MSTEKASKTVCLIDIADCSYNAQPVAGVFSELRIGRLEEDLDAVERTDYCLCLGCCQRETLLSVCRIAHSTSSQPSCDAGAQDVVQALLVNGCLIVPMAMNVWCCYRIVGMEQAARCTLWGSFLEQSRSTSAGFHL